MDFRVSMQRGDYPILRIGTDDPHLLKIQTLTVVMVTIMFYDHPFNCGQARDTLFSSFSPTHPSRPLSSRSLLDEVHTIVYYHRVSSPRRHVPNTWEHWWKKIIIKMTKLVKKTNFQQCCYIIIWCSIFQYNKM